MEKIEIPLQKRNGKFKLYVAVTVFMGWMFVLCIVNLIVKGFDWSPVVMAALLAFGLIAVGIALSDYYKQKNPKLAVESDGIIVRFFIGYDGGTANRSKSIKIENMKRFYLVTKKTRYLIKDKSFEFEPKKGILKTNIEVFPSLSDIDDAGVAKVMEFMGKMAPEIALGYYGSPLAQMFNK
ncbi:MAG TPA: hypothetical protein VK528_00430 [Flavobacterium sp.]|nr:hypothetical protein [Flavobacterium sp.]